MRIIKTKDYDAMSAAAARLIAAQITLKPNCVLGLATGSSPVGTYQNLIAWNKAGELDFSAVRSVNLDEYAGLKPDHDQSYAYFMRHNLFDHVNIDLANTNVPSGVSGDEECQRYDQLIADFGGIDLQLLGLGVNGGHDLNLENLRYFARTIPGLLEVSIGHALISDAIYLGMENTIQLYLRELKGEA